MKRSYQLSLILISMLLLTCTSLHAQEQCEEPPYPDQSPFNGCEGVTPLKWDMENSDEELGENPPSGSVSVLDGKPPYTWTVSGSGFYFDPAGNEKDAITTSPSITIYSINSCGTGTITVTDTDGCGSVTGYVRSMNGAWELISTTPCEVTLGGCGPAIPGILNDCTQGKIKITESWPGLNFNAINCGYEPDEEMMDYCINWICTHNNNYSQSCAFDHPQEGWTQCPQTPTTFYKYDSGKVHNTGSGAVYYSGSYIPSYSAYEWQCNN